MNQGNRARMDLPSWLRIASVLAGVIRRLTPAPAPSILVMLPASLGDVLLFSGALKALCRHFSAARIVVVCRNNCAELLAGVGENCCIVPLESKSLSGWRWVLWGVRLLRVHYDWVLHPVFSTPRQAHQICAVTQAEKKVWFDGETSSVDEVMAADPRAVYTQIVHVGTSAHELDKAVEFLRAIGVTEVRSRDDIRPEFHLTEKERKKARDRVVSAQHASPGALRLAVCVGARFKQKDWGVEKFVELIRQLAAQRPVVAFLLGDESDRERWKQNSELRIQNSENLEHKVAKDTKVQEAREEAREHRTSNIQHPTPKEQEAQENEKPEVPPSRRRYGAASRCQVSGVGESNGQHGNSEPRTTNHEPRTPILPRVAAKPPGEAGHSHTPTLISLAGSLTLRESVAVTAECDLCVGNDTFGLHAAIAVGTPSVVIMGGGNFGRWTPWGDPTRHRMVNAPMDCYGCGWKCIHPEYRCIQSITVEQVVEEIGTVLSS